MERAIERQLDEICRAPGMQGAICVDKNGLTLGVRGRMSPSTSGPVSSLGQLASTLHSVESQKPVVVVESQMGGKTLIKEGDGITTAVLRA
ncbi:ragulator complex protein LAMTOR5-like [Babylonia areolata]|uniref:ragulator complex protein LAMTOR5-like n=1 Tax=Babylonia areolata TaxID=304850 RepID=UPI003FD1D29F